MIQPQDDSRQAAVRAGSVLRSGKAENPFDVLIEEARAEREAGRTVQLRDFAAENGVDLGDEPRR
ncbi:hypothetical protein J0H33_16900 [bacterium]|nr:hypothetical protein [bacterium]